MVADGVIEAFTIRLGTELRQAEVRAIVLIEVQGKAADHVAQRLRGVPEVRALYSTNGRWDFVAELEDRDLASFDETLRRLQADRRHQLDRDEHIAQRAQARGSVTVRPG